MLPANLATLLLNAVVTSLSPENLTPSPGRGGTIDIYIVVRWGQWHAKIHTAPMCCTHQAALLRTSQEGDTPFLSPWIGRTRISATARHKDQGLSASILGAAYQDEILVKECRIVLVEPKARFLLF